MAGRRETKQQNVRTQVTDQLWYLCIVACLPHDAQTRLGFKEPPQASSENGMLVDDDDPDLVRLGDSTAGLAS